LAVAIYGPDVWPHNRYSTCLSGSRPDLHIAQRTQRLVDHLQWPKANYIRPVCVFPAALRSFSIS